MNQRNVLLVTIDSLRADYVNNNRAATATFDRLIDESTTYKNAFAQGPFTTFSMPSLFTSRYPSGLKYVEFSESTVGVYIDDEPTLPELLREAGYETAGFHSNPLLSSLFGFDRGFDTFEAHLPLSETDWLPSRAKVLADKLLRIFRKYPYLPAEKLNERALEWLDGRDETRPFFLWIHYMDVHGPYQAKSGFEYLNKYQGERLWRKAVHHPEKVTKAEQDRLKALYRAEVEHMDEKIGELVDHLKRGGLFDETILVVTADHGEQFGEHGEYSHPHRLYDELIHVPLIIRDPSSSPTDYEEVVELIDVCPTLCNRVGAKSPETMSGQDLSDSKDSEELRAFSEADITPAYNGCVRTSDWKYIRDEVRDTELLFDVRDDTREEQNVIGEYREVAAELREHLSRHCTAVNRTIGAERDVKQTDIDDDTVRNQLKDLGYLE